jgi:hypothetical protein
MVLVGPVMMAVSRAKESLIARHAAIRVLKQHMMKEPILKAGSPGTAKLFPAAIGTPRRLRVRSAFSHGKNPLPGTAILLSIHVLDSALT